MSRGQPGEGSQAGQVIWYVMLFPRLREPDACLREMAALTGGEATPDPHVTIGHLRVATTGDHLTERLRALCGPVVPICASEPFSFLEGAHPLFGYTLSLRVEWNDALGWWCRAVQAVLHAGASPPRPRGEGVAYHFQAVRHMALPPGEALARLCGRKWRVAFEADTLVVSQRIGDRFHRRLEHCWRD